MIFFLLNQQMDFRTQLCIWRQAVFGFTAQQSLLLPAVKENRSS
uniref:Uncharacterized protein n=1 Tax=Anguilla anguilla TaxID=7936 RepID=A0A0E9V9G9_ANGAN